MAAEELERSEPLLTHPFRTAAELLTHCQTSGDNFSGVMLSIELATRSEGEERCGLLHLRDVMEGRKNSSLDRKGVFLD